MKWYSITNKVDKAEIWIYEMIGEDFWTGGGVTAKNFQKELAAIKASQIDLHINSLGGSVQDGIGIYNQIKQHPAHVTTFIDGWACSIASVIALAGDKVIMAENGIFMVHNPMGGIQGYAKDMRNLADILDTIGGTMMMTYTSKTKKSESEMKILLDGETGDGTWMMAEEAMEFGFIDEMMGAMDMAACVKFPSIMAKAGFKHIPNDLTAKKTLPSEKDIEHALRDVGCSIKEAKTILARGYRKEDLRDVGPTEDPPIAKVLLRDVEPPTPARKDRVSDLLIRAERMAAVTN